MAYIDPEKSKACKKKRYHETKHLWSERQRIARRKIKLYIWEIKKRSKCQQCGEDHPALLDFHHRDQTTKEISLADAMKDKWSIERIDLEISKCDVLCVTCHRLIHFELDGGFGQFDEPAVELRGVA